MIVLFKYPASEPLSLLTIYWLFFLGIYYCLGAGVVQKTHVLIHGFHCHAIKNINANYLIQKVQNLGNERR